MMTRFILLGILVGHILAADKPAHDVKSKYWTSFSAPIAPSSTAQFTVDQQNLSITSTGDARAALEHCLLLGCEVVKVNGVTFYLPASIKHDEPLKAPISTMIGVKRAEELQVQINQHKGKVCFIWTGKQAEFADVLSMAAILTSQNVPFYFGIREELANKIKVAFF